MNSVTLCGHSLCCVVCVCVCVCVCAGQRISFSALARNPHKGLRARSSARPEVEEERKVPEKKEGVDKGRRKEAVDNGEQKRPVGVR